MKKKLVTALTTAAVTDYVLQGPRRQDGYRRSFCRLRNYFKALRIDRAVQEFNGFGSRDQGEGTMEETTYTQTDQQGQSRRSLIRKAAYSAPVVFAIAAAPKVALGASGNGNNGFGNGADQNTSAPGNSGKTGGGKKDSVGDKRGRR